MLEYISDPVSGMDGLRPFKGTASKITIHRTETDVKPNWQEKRKGLPHYTLDGDKVYMHLPLNTAAYTMGGGDHSPNSDAGVNIQIEWVGWARNTPNESDESYSYLAELVSHICSITGCPWLYPFPFAADSSVRQDWNRFEIASGIVGHGHAPYNSHWDPGLLDTDRLYNLRPTSSFRIDYDRIDQIVRENSRDDEILESMKSYSEGTNQRLDSIDEALRDLRGLVWEVNTALNNMRIVVDRSPEGG